MSLHARFLSQVARTPARVALVTATQTYSYADLAGAVDALVVSLRDRLAGRDTVAVECWLESSYVLHALALDALGKTQVPVPALFSAQQRSWIQQDAGAQAVLDEAGELTLLKGGKTWPGSRLITYTSGTTGRPKGVVLPEGAEEPLCASLERAFGHTGAPETYVSLLPASLYLEWILAIYLPLTRGHTLVWIKRKLPPITGPGWNLPLTLARVGRVEPTYAFLPPAAINDLAQWSHGLPTMRKALGGELRFLGTGGAAADPKAMARLAELGLPVYEGYGLSEAGAVVASNRPGEVRRGVGRLLEHVEARIADDGELLLSSPCLLLGYTDGSRPVCDGWLHTGDLARLAGERLEILGRKPGRLITSFGRNLSPAWLRDFCEAAPEVLACRVRGDGEAAVTLELTPRDGVGTTELEAALERLRAGLPAHTHFAFLLTQRKTPHALL